MKKLSLSQTQVLNKMKAGWSLERDMGADGFIHIREPARVDGGRPAFESVRFPTFFALYKRKLIKSVEHRFPREIFAVVETVT